MIRNIETIGFDADDTLWQNEMFYRMTEARFTALLGEHGDHTTISGRLLEAEKRNLKVYGYGIKGFTLSMIETAIEVTDGKAPASAIREILEFGRELLAHPLELLPGVAQTLHLLKDRYRLVLITKGDLFDQERKLAQSGLGDYFDAVEIVSEKTHVTYATLFERHGNGADHALMAGNSMKSDVIPALQAGAWGVYVPHEMNWVLEHAERPGDHPRFREITWLGALPDLLET